MHWTSSCGKLTASQGNIGRGQVPQCQRLVWCMNGFSLEGVNSPEATRIESLNGSRRREEAEHCAQQESPPPYGGGGETSKGSALQGAVVAVIKEGKVRTYDMGGKDSTLDMTKAIAAKL